MFKDFYNKNIDVDSSAADKNLGSISAALSGPRASPRRDFSGVSAGSFPETAAGNRA